MALLVMEAVGAFLFLAVAFSMLSLVLISRA